MIKDLIIGHHPKLDLIIIFQIIEIYFQLLHYLYSFYLHYCLDFMVTIPPLYYYFKL